MPVVVAGYADTDAIAPGTVYSDESTIVQASDTIAMSSDAFTDIPGLTISLTLTRPSAVLQLVQVDFQREYFQKIAFRPLCDGQAKNGISRALRFSDIWQNVFLAALWPGLSAGSHIFKAQATKGTLKNRKHCLVIMRI